MLAYFGKNNMFLYKTYDHPPVLFLNAAVDDMHRKKVNRMKGGLCYFIIRFK